MSAGTLAQGAQTRLSTETVAMATNALRHPSGKGRPGFKKTRVSDCDETISLNLMIKTCEVERCSVSHVEFCCSRLIMRRVLQFSQYIFFVAIRFIDLKKMSDCRYLVC